MFSIEKCNGNRKKIRLFGIPIFKTGKRIKGSYGLINCLEDLLGLKLNDKKIGIQHGWFPGDDVSIYDLERDFQVMLAWNHRIKQKWKEKSNTPCYVVGCPFIHYRRKYNIIPRSDKQKGTIAFPAHSTKDVKAIYDLDKYCEVLEKLPKEYQPITISLHYQDIILYSLDKEFQKRGFETICVSLQEGKNFYWHFYEILKKYKYATSNEPGTYMLYAIEMGIPFFIIKESELVQRDNRSGKDRNLPLAVVSILDTPFGRKAYELFAVNYDVITRRGGGIKITDEQRQFVIDESGVEDCMDRQVLRDILKNKIKIN